MESKWNAERQLHDNVRGLLPWSLEFWSAARKRLFWLVRWGCSQRLVCSLHTSSESFWMTWALVPHSTFLELKLEQTFWKRTSCWSQEAACRAVSELGQLPTRLSVSALKRVWDWLALTESNHCSRRPHTWASSACPGLQPPARLRQTAVCPRPRPLLWALANILRALELSSSAAAQKGTGVSDEWSCFCCQP